MVAGEGVRGRGPADIGLTNAMPPMAWPAVLDGQKDIRRTITQAGLDLGYHLGHLRLPSAASSRHGAATGNQNENRYSYPRSGFAWAVRSDLKSRSASPSLAQQGRPGGGRECRAAQGSHTHTHVTRHLYHLCGLHGGVDRARPWARLQPQTEFASNSMPFLVGPRKSYEHPDRTPPPLSRTNTHTHLQTRPLLHQRALLETRGLVGNSFENRKSHVKVPFCDWISVPIASVGACNSAGGACPPGRFHRSPGRPRPPSPPCQTG